MGQPPGLYSGWDRLFQSSNKELCDTAVMDFDDLVIQGVRSGHCRYHVDNTVDMVGAVHRLAHSLQARIVRTMHPAALYGLVGRRFDCMEKGEADKREIPCWKKFRQIEGCHTIWCAWETRPPGRSRLQSFQEGY
jgi:hypothetical protein